MSDRVPNTLPTRVTIGLKGDMVVLQSDGNDLVEPLFLMMTGDDASEAGLKLIELANGLLGVPPDGEPTDPVTTERGRWPGEGTWSVFAMKVVEERDAALARVATLTEALKEACDEYEYAMKYKGDHFVQKHGDQETLARLRGVLAGLEPKGDQNG